MAGPDSPDTGSALRSDTGVTLPASRAITLIEDGDVPGGEAHYPRKDAHGEPAPSLPSQIILIAGNRRVLVQTRPIPPNRGGMTQVSSAVLAALGGGAEIEAVWRRVTFRDLLRYSRASRRRFIGIALAAASAIAAGLKEGFDAADKKTSVLVAVFLASALLTFFKELVDAWQDWQVVREGTKTG